MMTAEQFAQWATQDAPHDAVRGVMVVGLLSMLGKPHPNNTLMGTVVSGAIGGVLIGLAVRTVLLGQANKAPASNTTTAAGAAR